MVYASIHHEHKAENATALTLQEAADILGKTRRQVGTRSQEGFVV